MQGKACDRLFLILDYNGRLPGVVYVFNFILSRLWMIHDPYLIRKRMMSLSEHKDHSNCCYLCVTMSVTVYLCICHSVEPFTIISDVISVGSNFDVILLDNNIQGKYE